MYPLINKRETGIKLRRIMDQRDISAKDVQEYLGLGCVQSIYRWLNGQSMPTIDNLYALSELFQVTIDEMVCGNRDRKLDALKISNEQHRRLYAYYEKLCEANVA